MLDGIKNFLTFIDQNWVSITICIGLILSICKKVKSYLSLSEQEKIDIAKKQIKETILKLVSDAESEYEEYVKAGEIKRSQVIEDIFAMYPILNKVTDQQELITWIDEQIDEALITLRDIIEENENTVIVS